MSRENSTNAAAIARIMEQFCAGSGQLVNKEKSHVLFSKNTSARIRKEIKSTIGLKNLKDGALYLGNNLIIDINKYKEFRRLKDKVQVCSEGWNAQLLSKVGKVTLI